MFSRKLKETSDFEAIQLGDNLLHTPPAFIVPEKFATNPNTRVPISPTLIKSMSEGSSFDDPPVILDRDTLEGVVAEALSRMPNHPFHNKAHIERVLKKLDSILEAGVTISGDGGKKRELLEWEKQALLIACAFHDMGHSGTQFRQLSSRVTLSEGRLFSNEENAAILTDELALRLGLSVSQRLTIQGLILGTTYGQNSHALLPDAVREDPISKDLIREYRPVTDLEKLVSYLDVASFDKDTEDFIADNINAFLENDPSDIPLTSSRWIAKTSGFLAFLDSRLRPLDGVITEALFATHRKGILELKARILNVEFGESVVERIKVAMKDLTPQHSP